MVVITGASSGIGRATALEFARHSAYAVGKSGIRALGESLRDELEVLDKTHIHICTVMPATIDTPFFRHAANYSGRAINALPPVYPASKVALTMLKCVLRPQREVFVGSMGRMMGTFHAIAPALAEPMMAKQIDKGHFKPEPAAPSRGALFEPMQTGNGESDGWHGEEKITTRRTTLMASSALPVILLAVWIWRQMQGSSVKK
ncbi:hypothetical protein KDH_02280 [Dictyobacter sp. S3.2.2.5]|uniref:Short-chain dehydrogenase n=1 Tax=Dictyobacter halimunensis TaxID=3026934 RepID=A0ABQ6FH80_9CHLR|nr:hypothetical protein KDH_02280 [Dictyobacter sp. S3.2.2.5]